MSGTIAGAIPGFPGAGYLANVNILATQHGARYMSAALGAEFFATTASAGTTVPIIASNLAATFVLANPATSTKYLELLSIEIALLNTAVVVGDISLYFQPAYTALTSTTALTSQNSLLGGTATPSALAYSAATFTGALTKGPAVASFGAVTASSGAAIIYRFDGQIVVPPGCAIALAGKVAQTQAMQQTVYWIEN